MDVELGVSVVQRPSYVMATLTGGGRAAVSALGDGVAAAQLGPAARLVADLAGVYFLGSALLDALLRAQGALLASGGAMALARPPSVLVPQLVFAGVDQRIPVYGSVAEAVAAVLRRG